MWLILQRDKPEDYVITTGKSHSVREFVERAYKEIGVEIEWHGNGVDEKGFVKRVTSDELRETSGGKAVTSEERKRFLRVGDVVVEVDSRYFRPTEVDRLLGDPTKAKEMLGWEPRVSFEEMVAEMVKSDIDAAERDQLCRERGYRVLNYSDE